MLRRGGAWATRAVGWVAAGLLSVGGLAFAQARAPGDESKLARFYVPQGRFGSANASPYGMQSSGLESLATLRNMSGWVYASPLLSSGFRTPFSFVGNSFLLGAHRPRLGIGVGAWFGTLGPAWAMALPVEAFRVFRVNSQFSAYVKAGLGVQFWREREGHNIGHNVGHNAALLLNLRLLLRPGIVWHVGENLSLRAETGYPYFLRLGLRFS